MHELGATQLFDPFPPNAFEGDAEHRHAANHALVLSALGLTLTGGIEFVIALVSGSVGLLGDAIHNLADVSTSLVAFVGFRVSRRGASASHPYGYERAEDLAGLGVALVIWASVVFAGYVSIHKLVRHGSTSHLWLGVTAAAVGIVREPDRRPLQAARRNPHPVQHPRVADAKHSWLDAIASAGALLRSGWCRLLAVVGRRGRWNSWSPASSSTSAGR